ncbi:MAG: DHHW family protein [Succinatimonas sp.]|nr:DHHW family protein [Succinatimonas sp.]
MKFFKLILKHLLALALTILVLNASLKVFSDGYNLDALSRSLLRSNAEINFDAETLKFNDGKDIKTTKLASPVYAKSKLSTKSFALSFVAQKDNSTKISLDSKRYQVADFIFTSNVVYKNITLKVNNKTADITDFKVQKGDVVSLSFKAKNAFPTLAQLKNNHHLNIVTVLISTLVFVVLYYVYIYKRLITPAFIKLFSLKSLGTEKIIFYVVFCIFLVVAYLGFNVTDTISVTDRRELASFPNLLIESPVKDRQDAKNNFLQLSRINKNFFNELNSYLEDRFGLRNTFLEAKLLSDISLKGVVQNGNCAWNKNTNWFASLGDFMFQKYDSNFNQKLLENVNHLSSYLNAQSIQFVLVIVPETYEVYSAENNFIDNKPTPDIEADTIKLLKEKALCPVVYPLQDLLNAKSKDYVYFKADHHWTDFGAYIGYQKLMDAIKQELAESVHYQDINNLDWNKLPHTTSKLIRSDFDRDFMIGESALAVGLRGESHLDEEYTYYDPQLPYIDLQAPDGLVTYRKWHNDEGYPLKLYTMGTSFNENLNPFFAATFKDVIYSRLNQGADGAKYNVLKYTKTLREEFKPDIIVLTLSVPNLRYFTDNNFGFEN